MKNVFWLSFASLVLLSGCSTSGSTPFSLGMNSNIKMGVALGVAGAIYLIYDPLAPNWEVEEAKLTEDTYRYSLKMKRFHRGGEGESLQIVKRRASQLQLEQGFASYEILGYSEGIDSHTIGAQRVAEGTIRLVKPLQADSFLSSALN